MIMPHDVQWYRSWTWDDRHQMKQLVVFRGGKSDPRRSANRLSTAVARLEHRPVVVVVLMYSLKFSSTVISAFNSWGLTSAHRSSWTLSNYHPLYFQEFFISQSLKTWSHHPNHQVNPHSSEMCRKASQGILKQIATEKGQTRTKDKLLPTCLKKGCK